MKDKDNEIDFSSMMRDLSFDERFNGRIINKYKAGSKFLYSQNYPQVVYEMMLEGYSLCVVAKKLGVNKATITKWCNKYPEFKDAIEIGKEHFSAYWEEFAYKNKDNKDILKLLIMENCGFSEKTRSEISLREEHIDFIKSAEQAILKHNEEIEDEGHTL